MKKVAMIPLRAGSKSIKNKNKKKMLGRPLFTWVLGESYLSNLDEVYVFTDDKDIMDYIKSEYKYTNKIRPLQRSEESSTDRATTEFAMQEFVNLIDHDYDLLFLLQATSPLTTKENINEVIDKLEKESFDSALTVVENKRFIWDNKGNSTNYDFNNRPRRQDFEGYLVENGAVYGTTKEQFEKTGIRIGGNIGIVKMPEDTLVEIDEPNDWYIVENLLENRLRKNKKKSSRIKALFLDVDGVFTKGTVYVGNDGELLKEFSLRDGMGIEILRENNIEVFVSTSEDSDIVKSRMNKLKIDNYYPGVKDKYTKIEDILIDRNYKREEIAYIGDDINDLSNIVSVGWSFCPKNAMKEIKEKVDIILHNDGGSEAIREAVNFITAYNKRED